MKKHVFVLTFVSAFLFSSCNILLPHPIDDEEATNVSTYEDDEIDEEDYEPNRYGISTPTKKEDKKVRKFLTSFYNTYKNGGYNEAPRQSMMSSALQAAITHIRNYENFSGEIVFDSDPFINAQDIVGGLNSGNFNIDKFDDENCIWQISYNNGFETIQILVQVVSENGDYKIHDVKYGEGEYATTLLNMANTL